MVGEIFGSISAFKAMFDIAKGLKDISDAAIRNTAVVELQEKILAAREAQTTALERIRELETQLATFETWETEKQRYKLKNLEVGSFVYALKRSMSGGETPHYICQRCYSERRKMVLQYRYGTESGADLRMHLWNCPHCKNVVRTRAPVALTYADDVGDQNAP